jgi:hypothetical protein
MVLFAGRERAAKDHTLTLAHLRQLVVEL